MKTMKAIFVVSVLGVLAYGLYAVLTDNSRNKPDSSDPFANGPEIDLTGVPSDTPPASLQAGQPPAAAPTEPPPVPLAESPSSDLGMADQGSGAETLPTGSNPLVGGGSYRNPATPAEGQQVSAETPLSDDYPNSYSQGAYPESHAQPGSDQLRFADILQGVQPLLDNGELVKALRQLSAYYGDPRLVGDEEAQLMDLLNRLAGTVIYSRQHMLEEPYVVQQGESFEQIAARFSVPALLLAKINGFEAGVQPLPGDELKVVRGPMHAIVDLQKYEITMVLVDLYAGRFPIGVGQEVPPAEGEFTVLQKVVQAPYQDTSAAAAAPPPEGGFWIDLGNGLGLQSTDDVNCLGQVSPQGCIHLVRRDMEDVYDMLSEGSTVVIRR